MIDEVRGGFAALLDGTLPPVAELTLLPLATVTGVVLAIDHERRRHLLLEYAEPPQGVIGTTAITVTTRHLVIGTRQRAFLDISCLHPSLGDVFDQFTVAVAEQVAHGAATPATAAADVIDRWREFLMPPRDTLGSAAAAAVIAELLVLRDLARVAPASAAQAWDTSTGARHDFRRGSSAVEIKMTTAHTARIVTIHGDDQLDLPAGGSLHLHLVRLEAVAAGEMSLGGLVDEILGLGVPAESVFRGLARKGVPASAASDRTFRFDIRERLTVPVDERTPRIVPSTFAEGQRPTGVVDVTYRVDLDHVLSRALGDPEYDAVVAALAGGNGE